MEGSGGRGGGVECGSLRPYDTRIGSGACQKKTRHLKASKDIYPVWVTPLGFMTGMLKKIDPSRYYLPLMKKGKEKNGIIPSSKRKHLYSSIGTFENREDRYEMVDVFHMQFIAGGRQNTLKDSFPAISSVVGALGQMDKTEMSGISFLRKAVKFTFLPN